MFFQFGYAPKGSSVIMYRCKEYIHSQYFISTKWSGNSITRISHLLFRSEFMSSPKSNSWRILKVAFSQKVRCGSKNYSKSLSWAENLNFPPKTVNNIFKFSAQDSDLEYCFELYQIFWQKATFKTIRLWWAKSRFLRIFEEFRSEKQIVSSF